MKFVGSFERSSARRRRNKSNRIETKRNETKRSKESVERIMEKVNLKKKRGADYKRCYFICKSF